MEVDLIMIPPTERREERGQSFAYVARVASVICFAGMAGFLYSVKQVNPVLEMEWGFGTLVMTVIGGWLAWILWNMAAQLVSEGTELQHRRRVKNLALLSGGVFLVMLISWAVAIKDVRRAMLLEILQGTSLALFVLAGIGFVLYRLVRWLESEKPNNEPDPDAPGYDGAEFPDDGGEDDDSR